MPDVSSASADDMKHPMRQYFQDVLEKSFDLVDELFADEYRDHDPANPNQTCGAVGEKEHVREFVSAFPDVRFTIEEMVTEGDLVVTRWQAELRHLSKRYK